MNFDAAFEDAILSESLRNEDFLKRASRICQAHHFSTKERSWLWGIIYDLWSKHRERATPKIVAARAISDFDEPDKRKPYVVFAKAVFKKRPKNPQAVLSELDKFVRHVSLQIGIEQAAIRLEKNDVEGAEKAIVKASRSMSRQRKYTHVRWIEEFPERQTQRKYKKEHPEEFTTVPLGFPKIDKILSGGGQKGEVGLIAGSTGKGKSICLNNCLMSCVKHGYNGILFGFEMPARQIAMRQDACWLGLEYTKFKQFDFRPSELRIIQRRFEKAKTTFGNRLHIVSMPVRSANIQDVRNAIDDLRQDFGFEADAIFLDSADHLRAFDSYKGEFRLQQAEVYWSLKELAEECGYFVVSSAQVGREWAQKLATAESLAESYDKSRIADLVLSLNDPSEMLRRGRKTIVVDEDDDDAYEKDKEIGEPNATDIARLMELYLAKYRDGFSRFKMKVACDYARMTITEAKDTDEEEDDE